MELKTNGDWQETRLFGDDGKMVPGIVSLCISGLGKRFAKIEVLKKTRGCIPSGILANVSGGRYVIRDGHPIAKDGVLLKERFNFRNVLITKF